ncbi:hypothetical protein [Alkalibacterium sp.]|nr:MAG: hypothetical protein EA249_01715 [Alkalibacterium sp.]
MISDKIFEEKGFMLVDALLSFGLIASLLIVTLPFAIELFHLRELSKKDVEFSRALYEEALFWTRQDTESDWLSGEQWIQAETGQFSIMVSGEGGYEKKVEIQSISWKE